MYNLSDIKDIHLEVTSKCQARCPMCPRRISGGMLNPLIELNEITLEQFKEWFKPDFVKQLNSLFMCGNLGDPIIAQDTLEIFQYLKDENPDIQLKMHTNGSARTTEWWRGVARMNVKTTFGIDGMGDTHHLYRISTDWHKIIENAKAFIEEGGEAEWHMLAFKHNEHQIEECRKLSQDMGFVNFSVKHTSRFTSNKWPALDDEGRTIHVLEPTQQSIEMMNKVKMASCEQNNVIKCKAVEFKQIYVGADGTVAPCCWLDFSWILHKQESRVDYMDQIGRFPNLNKESLEEIFNSNYFETIKNTWDNNPLMECSRQCGKFDKMREQFVEQFRL